MRKNKSNIQIVQDYLDGNRPFVQVGYTAPKAKRKIGEQWTDNHGVLWEQRDGYVARVNKSANIIKEALQQKCSCGMDIKYGGRLDEIFYRKTGKCFDCIIKEETEYRVLGVYGVYEKYKLLSNYLGFLLDMKSKIEDSIKYFEQDTGVMEIVCNSEGFVEKFRGMNKGELLENAKKDLVEVTKTIETVTKDKTEAKETFENALKKARQAFSPKTK